MNLVLFTCEFCGNNTKVSELAWSMGVIYCPSCGKRNVVGEKRKEIVGSYESRWNDEQEVLLENWAQGARIRLEKFGNLFLIDTKFMLSPDSNVYFLTSEESDARIFHMKYSQALLDGMDNPELLLPYPWMYDMGESGDDDDDDWLLDFLCHRDEPHIECPHCKSEFYDKSTIYRMMLRSAPSRDLCTLKCPHCGEEIQTYGYNEYYVILGVEKN